MSNLARTSCTSVDVECAPSPSPVTKSLPSAGLGDSGRAATDGAALPADTFSHPLVLWADSLRTLCRNFPSLCSCSRMASHSARVSSAFWRCSADRLRHSVTWASYSSFQTSSADSGWAGGFVSG